MIPSSWFAFLKDADTTRVLMETFKDRVGGNPTFVGVAFSVREEIVVPSNRFVFGVTITFHRNVFIEKANIVFHLSEEEIHAAQNGGTVYQVFLAAFIEELEKLVGRACVIDGHTERLNSVVKPIRRVRLK